MCSCDLPDMYAPSPWACGPRALGIYIRQMPCAHATTITFTRYQCVYLVNIPEPVQYHIYAMAFPFDLRCKSATCNRCKRCKSATEFKCVDSILSTNSNPQSIVDPLCLYKEWHHFPGYKLFASLFSGIHHICIPAFPFDPPTQSGTYIYIYIYILW